MYIVGIDIGKNHHEASIVDYLGKLIGRSCRFSNTHKGAEKLMEYLSRNTGDSSVVFGIEATGHRLNFVSIQFWNKSFLNTKNSFLTCGAIHQ